jgi:DNA-binding NarL/FixJ family response regulator
MRARIVLADDHRVLLEGLKGVLGSRHEVIGTAGNGHELVAVARERRPDVVIADISMPLLNGLDAMRAVHKSGTRIKFVVLTMHADIGLVVESLRAGASGYVLKSDAGEELLRAVDSVMRGRVYISSSLPNDLLTVLAEAARRPADTGYKLTKRQREVLQLVAEGKPMKEVAGCLGISARTAESYKYEMMHSLGLHSNAELVHYAIRIGLITVEPLYSAS